jgi:hypothetical protein
LITNAPLLTLKEFDITPEVDMFVYPKPLLRTFPMDSDPFDMTVKLFPRELPTLIALLTLRVPFAAVRFPRLIFMPFIVAMFDHGATRFPVFEMVVPEMVRELAVMPVFDTRVN